MVFVQCCVLPHHSLTPVDCRDQIIKEKSGNAHELFAHLPMTKNFPSILEFQFVLG